MKIYKFILDILAPKKCYICNKEGYFLCGECLSKEYDYVPICYVCKAKKPHFCVCQECKKLVYYDKIIISKHYKSSTISKLIIYGKYYRKKEIFDDFGEDLYYKLILNHKIRKKEEYIITNIPSTLKRKITRGKGSSEILCEKLSKISGIKFEKNILIKTKNTKQQSTLGKKEREKNLQDVFAINTKKVEIINNKNIIIIDDVISTGTTLNETAKILKKYNAINIIGLIIASG